MEWVETTGPTIEAALDAALDELGVDEDEVEFQVLQEPKSGLFGRIGASPARIRARVKPISREKPGDRSRRARSGRRNGPKSGGGSRSRSAGSPEQAPAEAGAGPSPAGGPAVATTTAERVAEGESPAPAKRRKRRRRRRRAGSAANSGSAGSGSGPRPQQEDEPVSTTAAEEIPIGEQADVADEFVRGLVEAFGVRAEVAVKIDEDAVLVDVHGEDLGLLVGPKGATLRAIEDLVRTVVQRRTNGQGARINVDIAGYQAKRRAALQKFAAELAQRVLTDGQELALEPMPPADRKIVHDTIAAIDGVTTISEGEEPRRRVVVRRA